MTSRLSAAVLAAAALAAAVAAQPIPWDNNQLYEKLGLSEQQASAVREVVGREDRVMREAQVELNIFKAQLEKLLNAAEPDLSEVERLLQASVPWKLKMEMAEIRRRVEIRKVLGERKWEQLMRAWRARQKGERGPDPRPADPRPPQRPR